MDIQLQFRQQKAIVSSELGKTHLCLKVLWRCVSMVDPVPLLRGELSLVQRAILLWDVEGSS